MCCAVARSRTFAVLVMVLALCGPGGGALAQPAEPPAEAPPAGRLLLLNEAIQAYLEGASRNDFAEARGLFERLLEESPGDAAGLYYLGLIHLAEGLEASAAAQRGPGEEQAREQARQSFAQAREYLSRVVEEVDPALVPVEAALDLGIAQLASQDVATAERFARQAVDTLQRYVGTPEGERDVYGHFFLAVALYRLNALERGGIALNRAAEHLERARLLAAEMEAEEPSPERARINYYQGLVLLSQGRRAEAREHLVRVTELDSGQLGANAQRLIAEIDRREAESPAAITFDTPLGPFTFEGRLNIGHFYDTNVILLGENTALPRGIERADDYRFGLEASFDFLRSFTRDDGILGESLLLGLGGTTTHLWQPNIPEFDINTYTGRTYVNWEPLATFFLGLQYDYAYTQLGHDPYISSNRITPVISKVWLRPGSTAELGRTDLFYSFDERDYFDVFTDYRFDRDGQYHLIGITQRFNVCTAADLWPEYYAPDARGAVRDQADSERPLVLRFGVAHRNESTSGTEFDLYGNSLSAGVEVPLPWRLAFGFATELTWDNYWNPSLFDFHRNERFDFVQRYDFGLSRILVARGEDPRFRTLDVRVRAGIELTFQDSNVWDRLHEEVYSYDRAIYGISLSISF